MSERGGRYWLLLAFRAVFFLAAALFFIPAGLLVASLFSAQLAPNSKELVGVSVALSLVFLVFGLLILGIQFRITAIAGLCNDGPGASTDTVHRHLSFLSVYLIVSGCALCLMMAIVTSGIVARLREGYPVFG